MAMINIEGEKKCPLCAEKMDWTDQQLKPCKCGYEVCVWCWHQIMDVAEKDGIAGRCPACQIPYDKEKIVGTEAKCERLIRKKEPELRVQKSMTKLQEGKKDLSNVRVIQRKMAYIIGLPYSLADEDLLQRKDYFGQYGKVCKAALSRTAGGTIQQFNNDSCSVYITYSKEEEAIRCIQSVHGFILEGRPLKASFGTAKYCHAWLKNVLCNPACLYLHSFGADEDTFSKDEEAAAHTRNRVHQLVGAMSNMKPRSGSMLPPPLDNVFDGSSNATEELISHSTERELNSNGRLTCSMPSEDQDVHIKAPNRSFLDVVAKPSSSGFVGGNVTEERKLLCTSSSDSSSFSIDENYHDTEYSYGTPSLDSSKDEDSPHPTANSFAESECYYLPLPNKDSENNAKKSFKDPGNYSVSGVADYAPKQSSLLSDSSHNSLHENQFSVLSSTDPIREISGGRDRYGNYYGYEVPMAHNVANSSSFHGFTDSNIHTHPDSGRKIRSSNLFSNEEIIGQLRRLDGTDNLTTNIDGYALDTVESNIVSSILSLDFDSCDELYNGFDGRHASRWNSNIDDKSRFLFTEVDTFAKEASGQGLKKYSLFSDNVSENPVQKENLYSYVPRNNGFRIQSSAPPGFPIPPKDPAGFSSRERTNHLQSASLGNCPDNSVSYLNNQYFAQSNVHIRSAVDFDLHAPRAKELNNPQHTTYDDEARLWLLMQQAGITQKGTNFHATKCDQPSPHQDLNFSVSNRDSFFSMGKSYKDQNQMYNQSAYSQFPQQKYGNTHVPNGYWSNWNGGQPKGEVGVPEVKCDRLGFDKFSSGHSDLTHQMQSTGYNRVYGF